MAPKPLINTNPRLLIVRDDEGRAVCLQGQYPTGEYGIAADEVRPFTDEELNDPVKFREHLDDLDKRIEEQRVSPSCP